MIISWAVKALIDKEVNLAGHNWNSQQMLSIPSSAFGSLRRELINTLGIERAKGFLLRYGWDCGVTDSLKIKKMKWDNPRDILLAGPKMHSANGHAQVEPTVCEVDFEKGTLHYEGDWKNSTEAIEHVKLFGYSPEPVCHSLVGVASGFLSTVMGKKVIARETKCIGMGDEQCHWICKTVEEWNGDPDIEKELHYYEADRINDELAETYEKLRIERDNLSKTHDVHLKLFKEVIYETGLQPIANILYETMKTPVMIETLHFEPRAVGGISIQEAEKYSGELKEWIAGEQRKKGNEQKEINQTVLLDISPSHKRVIAPIYFRQKINGYCSYLTEENTVSEADKMVLGQVALACSLHMLNERTRFNTEQRIRGSFLDDILNKRITMPEIVGRARYFDFELNAPYFMMAIHRQFEGASMKEELEFNDQFMNDLFKFLENKQIKGLLGKKSENVIILFSESNIIKSHLKKDSFSRQILNYCTENYPDLTFKVGVSSSCSSIEEASQLYNECLAAQNSINSSNLVFFDSLGIVGMLFQMKDRETIEKFAYKILGTLIEEDKSKNMELMITLLYYLKNGCNINKTARAMNFSINGLRYRLGKINEILQFDISEDYNRHEIYLALQCLIVLGELKI